MSLPAVKWGDVARYFRSNSGYSMHNQGGDVIIVSKSTHRSVRIGHNFLNHTKDLRHAHLRKIERTFGITRKDILDF